MAQSCNKMYYKNEIYNKNTKYFYLKKKSNNIPKTLKIRSSEERIIWPYCDAALAYLGKKIKREQQRRLVIN